ncbi:MAG: ferrous iron transport protein B [Clostridiales bacterium]|nr:ferrous iron transport protein B [Clostridiales bacterium]
MTLADLKVGEDAVIHQVGGEEELRHHLLDMGLIPGVEVSLIKLAPMGDPMEFLIRGYSLTIRKEDAAKIQIEQVHKSHDHRREAVKLKPQNHPGVGEERVYQPRKGGLEIPEGHRITFALAGNQNCGKTTLFNQLTGSNQHVGNFPGVTVDQKQGVIRSHSDASVVDLPGIYSLSPYSSEEIVTREFLLQGHPEGIINILDATNIERNLYLTLQLIELDIPMVLALNMMDEVRENGGTIRINELERRLGIPVVPISAAKNEGIEELAEHCIHVARNREKPRRLDFCDADGEDGLDAVHRCIHAVIHLIADHAEKYHIPVRFAATKLVERDQQILKSLHLDENEQEMLDHMILQMEQESGRDCQAAIADMRFRFIDRLCRDTVVRPRESKERKRSEAIDRVLTGKYTAIPSFVLIMAFIFWMTFGVVGSFLSDLLEIGIQWVTDLCDKALTLYGINEVVHSLIIDGIFAGVGSVLSFLPIIVVLFFFLSILEDTGYMARIAFVMDKLLRKIGLSGRSFVPMLIGFGCSVPAIMATRTLPSDRDRKMTILLTPFMSCSAKLPIYALFAAAFFPGRETIVMISLYFVGILVAIAFANLLKGTMFHGEPVPFVMELPNYRFPSAKSIFQLIWDKAKDFVTRAFTVIFIASILIWFLQTFDARLNVAVNQSESLLAMLGSLIAPVFRPLHLDDWRISTALITGFTAKESVVSTLTVLLGGSTELLHTMFQPLQAMEFLVFSLLYTPCVAAIATVRRELGSRWAVGLVFLQCAIAWVVAWLVMLVGNLAGL